MILADNTNGAAPAMKKSTYDEDQDETITKDRHNDTDNDEVNGVDDDDDVDDPDNDESKMVDWKNPPELRDLQQNYQDALPSHNTEVQKVEVYLENLKVTGKAKPKKVEGRSSIQPKLIRKQAEWRYPALSEPFLSMPDLFKVSPVTWEDGPAAVQNELLLNNQFNTKIDRVRFIDKFVRTLVNQGTAILKTGWCYEEKKVKEKRPKIRYLEDPEYAPMHEQLAQMKEESPSDWQAVEEELKIAHQMTIDGGVPIRPESTGEMEEVEVTKVVRNHPTVEVCKFRNTVVDPTAMGDIKKAQFVVTSYDSNLSKLKSHGSYKNLNKIQLNENAPLSQADHDPAGGYSGFQFLDDPRKIIVVHEYYGMWDIDGTGIVKPIIVAWVGLTCIRMEELPFADGSLPFEIVQYMPGDDENTGEPDAALLEDNQLVSGAVMRGLIDSMGRSAAGQTGMRKDMLDETNKRRFQRGEDYFFNGGVDPRQGVFHHTYPEIPQSAQYMLQLQNFEAESLTGVKSFSQGVSGSSLGDVAAGIRGALDAASKRELSILRRMKEGIVAVGRRFIAMNAEMLSDEEVIRVTNDEFVTVKRDDLPGSFDLKLGITTAEEDEKKSERLAFMLQTLGPSAAPDFTKIILMEIARLSKMPELEHKLKTYQPPPPDPMQQQIAQLQMQKLQAEIAEIQGRTVGFQATAQLNQAKIGTEQAKAANLASDTDIKNLDFVEQESGTKQERDIQKIGEQARSNTQMRVADHQMKMQEKTVDHINKVEQDKFKLIHQYKLKPSKK
jgi:hypothetical protein